MQTQENGTHLVLPHLNEMRDATPRYRFHRPPVNPLLLKCHWKQHPILLHRPQNHQSPLFLLERRVLSSPLALCDSRFPVQHKVKFAEELSRWILNTIVKTLISVVIAAINKVVA